MRAQIYLQYRSWKIHVWGILPAGSNLVIIIVLYRKSSYSTLGVDIYYFVAPSSEWWLVA